MRHPAIGRPGRIEPRKRHGPTTTHRLVGVRVRRNSRGGRCASGVSLRPGEGTGRFSARHGGRRGGPRRGRRQGVLAGQALGCAQPVHRREQLVLKGAQRVFDLRPIGLDLELRFFQLTARIHSHDAFCLRVVFRSSRICVSLRVISSRSASTLLALTGSGLGVAAQPAHRVQHHDRAGHDENDAEDQRAQPVPAVEELPETDDGEGQQALHAEPGYDPAHAGAGGLLRGVAGIFGQFGFREADFATDQAIAAFKEFAKDPGQAAWIGFHSKERLQMRDPQ